MKRKTYYLLTALIVLTLVFQGVNIYLSNKLSSNSIQASSIQDQLDNLTQKNIALRTEVLSYSSYENIASRAASLGYTYTKQYISLKTPLQVAQR